MTTGQGGRPSAPTALKVLKGERPSRINRREPRPDLSPEVPEPPSWMSPDAMEVWDRLVPDLHAKGVLTPWDADAFATYCECVIHHRDACITVDRQGVLIQGERGLVKNPALQIIRDQATILKAFAVQFGLTPSSRAGLEMPDEDEGETARQLLS